MTSAGYYPGVAADAPRNFTPAAAEALLPEINRLLEAAQALIERYDQFPRTAERSPQVNGQVHRNGEVRAEPSSEVRSIQADLQRIIEQIQAHGVIVRDLRSGLIDFPSLREGRSIYLCWQRGEPLRIEWWHPTSTGIAGRQRL